MKVLSPSDLRCPETGKKAFVTHQKASELRVEDKIVKREAYRCPFCHWWHRRNAR